MQFNFAIGNVSPSAMNKSLKIGSILDRRVENDEVEYLVKSKSRAKHAASDQNKENNDDDDCVWVKEQAIKDVTLIRQFNEDLTKERQIDQIIGATPANGKCIWFYVQWLDEKTISGAWLPAYILKEKYPQELIKFYEKNLTIAQ